MGPKNTLDMVLKALGVLIYQGYTMAKISLSFREGIENDQICNKILQIA